MKKVLLFFFFVLMIAFGVKGQTVKEISSKLVEAMHNNSKEELSKILDDWTNLLKPATDSMRNVNDTVKTLYEIFETFNDKDSSYLLKYGEIYYINCNNKNYIFILDSLTINICIKDTLVVFNSFSCTNYKKYFLENFRPLINCRNTKIIYYNPSSIYLQAFMKFTNYSNTFSKYRIGFLGFDPNSLLIFNSSQIQYYYDGILDERFNFHAYSKIKNLTLSNKLNEAYYDFSRNVYNISKLNGKWKQTGEFIIR